MEKTSEDNGIVENGIHDKGLSGKKNTKPDRVKSSSLNEADRCKSERPVVLRKTLHNWESENSEMLREEMQTLRRRSASVLEYKEHAHLRLKEELRKAQDALKLKDQEVQKLLEVRDQMDKEIDELSASLFEEANNMVQDAHLKRLNVEKLLRESNLKVEGLEAEVRALKTLVITSTPSTPNTHLHPQLQASSNENSGSSKFVKGHRRSTSHHNINRELQLSPVKNDITLGKANHRVSNDRSNGVIMEPCGTPEPEMDMLIFELFQDWRKSASLEENSPFIRTMFKDEVHPCMHFCNSVLSKEILDCIMSNTLTIEPVKESSQTQRLCALTQCERQCQHEVRLRDSSAVFYISVSARNRLAAVCDFFTYLRYITQGLVKSSDIISYWEIIRLRKAMCMSKLGLL